MTKLNVAQIVSKTEAEGPGFRFGIWVQGCSIHCASCCNPEMLAFKKATEFSIEQILLKILSTPKIEGVSFLGGEPVEQAEPLSLLAKKIQKNDLSVVLFSGFTLEELKNKNDQHINLLLENSDVLIDGRYDQTQRTTKRRWIGSSNQKIHFLSKRYNASHFSSEDNHIELRFIPKNKLVSINGFPVFKSRS